MQFAANIFVQDDLTNRVFTDSARHFEEIAWRVFVYQYEYTPIYRAFCDTLGRTPATIYSIAEVPYLPISFFKSHEVIAEGKTPSKIFESSTTTGGEPSRHLVADLNFYEQSYLSGFERVYGNPAQYVFVALLPSYIERGTSSLLYMAEHLIRLSGNTLSGFINKDTELLKHTIQAAKMNDKKLLLLGVSYALWDLAEQHPTDMYGAIIMETGGMKGRREEITRVELHEILKAAFNVPTIHSEYGMTELLSQAYSIGDGIFSCPPWMRVEARNVHDYMDTTEIGKTGILNVIDLANLYSCSFLTTADLGRVFADGSFEVLGRMDHAELRGCNLMYGD